MSCVPSQESNLPRPLSACRKRRKKARNLPGLIVVGCLVLYLRNLRIASALIWKCPHGICICGYCKSVSATGCGSSRTALMNARNSVMRCTRCTRCPSISSNLSIRVRALRAEERKPASVFAVVLTSSPRSLLTVQIARKPRVSRCTSSEDITRCSFSRVSASVVAAFAVFFSACIKITCWISGCTRSQISPAFAYASAHAAAYRRRGLLSPRPRLSIIAACAVVLVKPCAEREPCTSLILAALVSTAVSLFIFISIFLKTLRAFRARAVFLNRNTKIQKKD